MFYPIFILTTSFCSPIPCSWGKQYQAILKSNGAIILNYYGLEKTSTTTSNLERSKSLVGPAQVGIVFSFSESSEFSNAPKHEMKDFTYSVNWFTQNIRNGLSIR